MNMKIIRGHLNLSRTRRLSLRIVSKTEKVVRRKTAGLSLKNLGAAVWALQLLPRNVSVYLNDTGLTPFRRQKRHRVSPLYRQFAKEIRKPPDKKIENPLKDDGNFRESASYLISSPGIRSLQSRIVSTVWENWFGLKVTGRQAAVLGSYSNAAWLSRGLMKAGGLLHKKQISQEEKKRLKVVLEPYVRNMELRRAYLEGLSRPGRALLRAWSQKRRLSWLRHSGFSPEDLEVLYPHIIDSEALKQRRQAVVSLKDEYIRKIRVRNNGTRFENYMHLQTLIMGAPSRGPVRFGRFMAAVERRQV